MEVVGMIFFWIFLLLGIAVIPFGIAGTFIIVADAFIYGLITGFDHKITLPFVGLLLAIAILVELIEELLSGIMAKKFGGSKWAMVGAIAGGFFGAVIGTPPSISASMPEHTVPMEDEPLDSKTSETIRMV